MLSAASVEDDDCASVTPSSEASGSSSANSHNKKRSRIGSSFKAFQFHLMIKTDLRDGGGRPGFGRRHCAAGALGAGLRGYPQ
jgi:hypothetical protein